MTQSYYNRSPKTSSFQQNTLRRAEKQDRVMAAQERHAAVTALEGPGLGFVDRDIKASLTQRPVRGVAVVAGGGRPLCHCKYPTWGSRDPQPHSHPFHLEGQLFCPKPTPVLDTALPP